MSGSRSGIVRHVFSKAGRSLCRIPGSSTAKAKAAPSSAPECERCGEELRARARKAEAEARRAPDPRTFITPRFTYGDWERGL